MLRWHVSFISKAGALALILFIAWQGWETLGPRKPAIGPVRQELADKLLPTIVEDLRVSRGTVRRAVLLHFGNDPTDYFTNQLRQNIEQNGVLDLRDRTLLEKSFNILDLRHISYPTLDLAIEEGSNLDAGAVLYGAVLAFESYPGGASIDVEVSLAEVSTGRIVFAKRYQVDDSLMAMPTAAMRDAAQSFPWFQRLLGWLVVVLLLPVFTISFISAMVRKSSNRTNAFVLGVYTLADAVLAWLLVGGIMNSWFPVSVFIVAVATALLYNMRIMAFAVRIEEA